MPWYTSGMSQRTLNCNSGGTFGGLNLAWDHCGTGYVCSPLPSVPKNQPSDVPWGGNAVMEAILNEKYFFLFLN